MSNNSKNPYEYDTVLDSQNIAPANGSVLGGIDRLKRLPNQLIENPLSTLSEAFNYGEKGLAFVIQALNHSEKQIRQSAYELLKDRQELEVKAALEKYLKQYNLIRFDGFYQTSDNLHLLRFYQDETFLSVNVAAYSYQKKAAQIVARLLNTDDEYGVKGSYTIEGNALKFSTSTTTPTPPTVNYYGEIEMYGDVISLIYNYHTYKNIRKYNFVKLPNI